MNGTNDPTTNTTPTIPRRTTQPTPSTPSTAPTPPDRIAEDRDPRPTTPETPPTVPQPRRSPATRRPLGPAGSGPGAAGRGPTRTGPRRRPAGLTAAPSRPAPTHPINAAGAPLPTVGAQRRAHEHQPHHWFAHQLVLTLSGQRPVHALLGHALPRAYDRLVELAPQAPLRPVIGPDRRLATPTVRDCGLCRPRTGVIEAFARIALGERLRALAFRLERGGDSRWRCAALDIGPTRAVWGLTP
ncbi:Rv3235 family protein [Streptomyces sp. NPDC050636]|uniref:Rv3235 family protein n=1 Tax=Streptomyces sp. NPDC050636 TaxID=3154510 RepID=UPI0034190343